MASFDLSTLPTISRRADLSIYTRSALAITQSAFKGHCRVHTTPISADRLLVSITPLKADSEETRTMILEFWNYFLDQSCQQRLG
jgi:hypothetical protein